MDEYSHGREHGDLERQLRDLADRVAAHESGPGHEHEHELAPEEVEEILDAAAEVVKELVDEAPEEAKEEVEAAAEALEEACEEVAEAVESPEVDEEEPERVHPLYKKI